MKAREARKKLENLRKENKIFFQRNTDTLVHARRESFKRFSFFRKAVKFVSFGKLCKLDEFSWTYEILEEVKRSFWFRELKKLVEFQDKEIEFIMSILPDDDMVEVSNQIVNLIRILDEGINE